MTKVDFLILAGLLLVALGLGMLSRPIGVIALGVVFLIVGAAAHNQVKQAKPPGDIQ